jgi:hypothetical protein
MRPPWLVARAGGYRTKESARPDGLMLKDAVLLAGNDQLIGVDTGNDRQTTSSSDMIKD